MTRYSYAGGAADFVFDVAPSGFLRLRPAALLVWADEAGGVRVTDLQIDGVPVTSIPVDDSGQVPAFEGPDDFEGDLWVATAPDKPRIRVASNAGTQRADAAADRAEAAAAQAEEVTGLTTVQEALAAADADPESPLRQAQDTRLLATIAAIPLEPLPVDSATYAASPAPLPVGSFGGYAWAAVGGQLHRSTNGKTWTPVGSSTGFSLIQRVTGTADGEILVAGSRAIRKSSGWSTNPSTATWSEVWSTPDADTFLAAFSYDFNDPAGQTFVASHYTGTTANWSKSRYAWLSEDAGSTWTIVYDSVALYGATPAAASHVHGVCYDSWEDRLWVSEGHDSVVGVRWSDDKGATWTKITKGELANVSPAPTTLVATPTGLCCASDSIENGVYGIARTDNPADLAMKWLWQWRVPEGYAATAGFGQSGWYDSLTGLAVIGFGSNFATADLPIVAGNALTASPLMYVLNGVGTQNVISASFSPDRSTLLANTSIPGRQQVTARLTGVGARPAHSLDRGGVLGGEASNSRSLAVGVKASAGVFRETVVAGVEATATGRESVAVGYGTAVGEGGVAVGRFASAGTSGVAVGRNTKASPSSVVVGNGVDASAAVSSVTIGVVNGVGTSSNTTIGNAATTQDTDSTAMGASSVASKWRAVAIGSGATARQQRSVSVGSLASCADVSGANGSVAVGATASAASHSSVAVGFGAKAVPAFATAVGALAESTHDQSVAVGYNSKTTAANQVMVGDRDIESTRTGGGVMLKSPDGTRYKVTVANGGTLAVAAV